MQFSCIGGKKYRGPILAFFVQEGEHILAIFCLWGPILANFYREVKFWHVLHRGSSFGHFLYKGV